MTYYESAEGVEISKARAIAEIKRHGCEASEFFAECGERETYQAQDVLNWLGY